eukprot:s2085_g8.t1
MAAELKAEVEGLVAKISDKAAGQSALEGLAAIAKDKGRPAEPFLVAAFPKILEASNDKSKNVKDAAVATSKVIMEMVSPFAVELLLPSFLSGLAVKAKPTQKEATLQIISALAAKAPRAVGYLLVNLVAPVADLTCDIKKEVKTAALECMTAICGCTGNKDLEPFLPAVVDAASSIDKTHACVEKLAGCIFVQNVEAPALAVTMPVLTRGLNDKNEEVKRTCCQIVDNMCKLVEDPAEVLPLMPKLEPLVKSATEKISDPEARGVAEKAYKTLQKAAGEGAESLQQMKVEDAKKQVSEALGSSAGSGDVFDAELTHVSALAACAANMRVFDEALWKSDVGYLPPFDSITEALRAKMEIAAKPKEEVEEEDTEGVDLYKGAFSLAYGTLTLLRDAKMHLKRNRFYGLLGPNQCGKTTLMRAIANEQLEGFPKRDELKSVFVEHEIEDEEVGVQDDGFPILSVDKPGWWWVVHTCNDIYKLDPPVKEDTVKELMKSIGFGYPGGPDRAANLELPVTSYSGGWKMKMQLCAAQLMNADVLMLDEPTGHLDVDNIKWLEDWLESFDGSIICTSHFSPFLDKIPFLDKMCTHIIDFQDRKLKTFKGVKGQTLTQFVEKYPEKKSYFEIRNDNMRFVFPEPGALEGVKSRSKVILRMNNVSFTYPTKDKPTIMDVSLTVSQVSRVAVIGANGAGKSTAIKVLVGEQLPTEGTIWKAQGLRMAYVAQHAFHHLEKHMQETPTQYIMWRFAGNDDRESIEFKTEDLSVDEEKARAQKWCIDSVTGNVRRCTDPKEDAKKAKQDEAGAVVPDAVVNRRQKKKEKTFEYEVKWQFKSMDNNTWVEKDIMVKMGYIKLVQREDERQAAMAGLMTKQLTQPGVEKHLADFGVDAESASHTQINQLSGGMKVKIVLAAAMWQNPHVLILDEPTNYLDRDGLGALILAIKDYKGGVLIISHNKEFCDSVATEKWIMQAGRLRIEGESIDNSKDDGDANKGPDEVFDGAGNKIEVKKSVTMTEKDKKKSIKDIEKKIKDGKKKQTMTDEEIWELEDKLNELKESLKGKEHFRSGTTAAVVIEQTQSGSHRVHVPHEDDNLFLAGALEFDCFHQTGTGMLSISAMHCPRNSAWDGPRSVVPRRELRRPVPEKPGRRYLGWSWSRCHRVAGASGAAAASFCSAHVRRSGSSRHLVARSALVEQLTEASEALEVLRGKWDAVKLGEAERLQPLADEEVAIREAMRTLEFGDPAEIQAIPQIPSADPVVAGYYRVARALLELEVAQKEWEVRTAQAAGFDQPSSPEVGAFASRLLGIALLRIRLFQHSEAYELLQRALPTMLATQQFVGSEGAAAKHWLQNLCRSTAMSQILREPGHMQGVDISNSEHLERLQALREELRTCGYAAKDILGMTQVPTLEMFADDDLCGQAADALLASAPRGQPRLAELVRFFLLSRPVPLKQLTELLGSTSMEFLLEKQAVTVIRGPSCALVKADDALKALENPSDDFYCFANIKIWPVEDLLIATDRQTWPSQGFEPVMYLSDDSWGLIYGAPREEVDSVLDLCTGSGVQGLVALQNYAKTATFVDLNPRALDFVRFNVALNGLSQKVSGIYEGNLYQALPPESGPFDAILANPPFLPNPRGIGSQCSAKFGDGGDFGEDILEAIMQGVADHLKPAGHLSAVTYAPNTPEMAERILRYLKSPDEMSPCITVFSSKLKPAKEFKPVSSAVEAVRYQEALDEVGIKTMAEAITVVSFEDKAAQTHFVLKEHLFQDEGYLRSLWKQHLDGCSKT